jgi:succinate dehydrogenase hydrophobic anchor subunit
MNVLPRSGRGPDAAHRGVSGRLMAYLFIRVTGVLLAVLVLGHFTVTHITTDVARTGPAFVGRRWHSALWVTWDWLMLAAALAHAACGLWVVVDDYVAGPAARRRAHALLVAVTCVLMIVGSVVVAAAVLG